MPQMCKQRKTQHCHRLLSQETKNVSWCVKEVLDVERTAEQLQDPFQDATVAYFARKAFVAHCSGSKHRSNVNPNSRQCKERSTFQPRIQCCCAAKWNADPHQRYTALVSGLSVLIKFASFCRWEILCQFSWVVIRKKTCWTHFRGSRHSRFVFWNRYWGMLSFVVYLRSCWIFVRILVPRHSGVDQTATCSNNSISPQNSNHQNCSLKIHHTCFVF